MKRDGGQRPHLLPASHVGPGTWRPEQHYRQVLGAWATQKLCYFCMMPAMLYWNPAAADTLCVTTLTRFIELGPGDRGVEGSPRTSSECPGWLSADSLVPQRRNSQPVQAGRPSCLEDTV